MKNGSVSNGNSMDTSEIISVARIEEPPRLFRNTLKHKIFSLVTPLGESKGIYERSLKEK